MDIRDEVVELLVAKAPLIFGASAKGVALGPDTRFPDLNTKSVHMVQISAALEDEYEIEVPFMEIIKVTTFADVGDLIDRLLSM
jgi:acyl carrier protein